MQIGQPLVSQRPKRRRLAAIGPIFRIAAIGPIFRERHCALSTLADVEPFATPAAFE